MGDEVERRRGGYQQGEGGGGPQSEPHLSKHTRATKVHASPGTHLRLPQGPLRGPAGSCGARRTHLRGTSASELRLLSGLGAGGRGSSCRSPPFLAQASAHPPAISQRRLPSGAGCAGDTWVIASAQPGAVSPLRGLRLAGPAPGGSRAHSRAHSRCGWVRFLRQSAALGLRAGPGPGLPQALQAWPAPRPGGRARSSAAQGRRPPNRAVAAPPASARPQSLEAYRSGASWGGQPGRRPPTRAWGGSSQGRRGAAPQREHPELSAPASG